MSALPANVRINMPVPFPARVTGGGIVTVIKQNGVWTVGLDFSNVAEYIPPAAQFPTSYIYYYNASTKTYATVSLTDLADIVSLAQAPPTKITFAQSPYTVLPTDTRIYVDTSGGPITINLQAQAARLGADLSIKDVTGNANANNISVYSVGGELIDGFSPYPIGANYGGIRIGPVTGGYTIIP